MTPSARRIAITVTATTITGTGFAAGGHPLVGLVAAALAAITTWRITGHWYDCNTD